MACNKTMFNIYNNPKKKAPTPQLPLDHTLSMLSQVSHHPTINPPFQLPPLSDRP